MNINNLFFHIYYCNHRQANEEWKFSKKITRRIRHHELFFISGGKGYIDIENKRYCLKKGMLFYFCPGLLHSIETDLHEPICFMSVHFNFAHVDLNDNKWEITSENEILPLQHVQELIDYYPIKNTFRKLIESWNVKTPGYEFISRGILQQMLFEVFENIKKQTPNYSTSLKVKKIIKYMHKNINRKLTLTELSELVHLSPTYLSRIFKKTTGYSIVEFFNKMKINKGKELIIQGNRKVKEVAEILGFKDEFYFSRIFKKIEGISPAEFYSKNVHGV